MKVIYIGVLQDGSGWSHAANDNILALDKVGIEVVPRSISFKESFSLHDEMPSRVKELMDNDEKGCDICIQHIPPSYMSYNGNLRCIGIFESETSHFSNSGWADYLNLMDEVWVPNNQMVSASRLSGVKRPIKVVPHTCDVSKYSQYYEKIDNPLFNNKFMFYTIGDFNRRKNFAALLKAFHLEFHPSESVGLFIKSGSYGSSDSECNANINHFINSVKKSLRLYPNLEDYIQEVVITNRVSDLEIMRIHYTFDCFVSPSFGEAWNIPAFDAMAMGKTPICTDIGGPADYLKNKEGEYGGSLIGGQMTPVFFDANEATPFGLFCANEDWLDININELRMEMRSVYEMNKDERLVKANIGIDRAYDFSYSEVGGIMKEILNGK